MSIVQINSRAQFNELLKTNENVIVDFYADWCGPCKDLATKFEAIQNTTKKVAILKVNIDDEELEDLVTSHNVKSLPHVFYYNNNSKKSDFVGNDPEKLQELLKKIK